MMRDTHRGLRESLGAYVLGHLDADGAGIQAHLDACADCRAECESLAPLAVALRDVDPDALERRADPVPDRRTAMRRGLLIAVACAAIIVAFGTGAWTGRPTTTPVPLEAVAVSSEVPGVEASADLVDHTWGLEIKLAASGLETGQPYRATVIAADGRQVDAGEFLGVAEVEIHCNMNASVLRDDAVRFSVRDNLGREVLTADL